MSIGRVTCTCRTCGKTFEVSAKRANSKQAREFEEWAENHIVECHECAAKRVKAEKDAFYIDIDTSDYCELRGSEKQIAWANDIRRDFIAQEIDPLLGKSTLTPTLPKFTIDYADLRSYAVQISSAKWWIDARFTGFSYTMRQLIIAYASLSTRERGLKWIHDGHLSASGGCSPGGERGLKYGRMIDDSEMLWGRSPHGEQLGVGNV